MKKLKKLPLDLLIMLLWTIFTLVFVVNPLLRDTIMRTVLGIPTVLFIPGYVLIAALFPRKDDLDALERIALSLGFSVAIAPLLGFLLNFTFGIWLLPLLITLCIYNIALVIIAAYRREKVCEEERFSVSFHRMFSAINNETNVPGKERILNGILIFVIVLAIGIIYYEITTPKIGERFTEFYILDPAGGAYSYPANLKYDSPNEMLVGVVNHEYVPVNYTVRVALEGEVLSDTWFRLNHNTTWTKNITYVPDKIGTGMKLEFWLFKEDNFTSPYRELHLWVNVTT